MDFVNAGRNGVQVFREQKGRLGRVFAVIATALWRVLVKWHYIRSPFGHPTQEQ